MAIIPDSPLSSKSNTPLRKSNLKKRSRFSLGGVDAAGSGGAGSGSGSGSGSGNTPLRASTSHRSVNIDMSAPSSSLNGHSAPLNDDKAEKANRRKSAHFGPLVEDGPALQAAQSRSASGAAVLHGTSSTASVGSAAAGQQKRHVSALQAQGRRKRLSAVNPDMPVISLEERQGNFEEWMKLATDNVCQSWRLYMGRKRQAGSRPERRRQETDRSADISENHSQQHLELCTDRLLCRHDATAERTG